MWIVKLEAQNVYSFESIQLEFESGVYQITGVNLDEKRTNEEDAVNGIGKTNLYNLISQALYSKDVYKTKKDYLKNLYISKPFSIKLWTDSYYIEYTKEDTKLYKLGETNPFLVGRKAVTEFFETWMPFDLFLPLTYLSSSVYFPFFDATPKQQKEFISLVFADLMKLKDAIPTLKEERSEQAKLLKNVEAKIEVYTEQVEQEIEEVNFTIPELEVMKDYSQEINALQNKLSDIKHLEDRKKLLEARVEPEPATNYEDEIIKTRDRISKGKAIIELEKIKLQKMEKLDGKSECPECGAPVEITKEEVEKQRKTVNKMQKTLFDLQEYLKKILVEQGDYETKKKRLAEYTKSQNELATIHIDDPEPIRDEIIQLRLLQQKERENFEKTKELRDKLLQKQAKINEQIAQKEKAQKELTQLIEQQTELSKLLNKIDLLIQICEKVIIEKQIPERLHVLEKFINLELSSFTSQYYVKLEMKKDKIVPKILKDNKEYPFQNCSQGEKGRINLALVLAIRDILPLVGKEIPMFLFIDELLNIIDTAGKLLIVNILEDLNITTCIICHDFEFPVTQIQLVKEDNKTCLPLI